MALNPKHVYAPSPVQNSTTGAVAVAATSVTAPTDAKSTLGTGWTSGGYVDENGISLQTTRSVTPLKDWSKAAIKEMLSDFGGSITVNFLQVDQFAAERLFGSSNVTVTAATSSAGEKIKVNIGANLPPVESWCFSMKDGDARLRVYVPRGQITEVAQMDFKPDTGLVFGGTIQCYDDGTGKSIVIMTDDGVTTGN